MNERNCDILLKYLQNILYDPNAAPLDLDALDEPFQPLGQTMQMLHSKVVEILGYSAQLSDKAYIDPVTSVYNRIFFEEYMEQSLLQKKTLTLAYMDLDNLKYVNDTYGHREGDQYIQTFTNLISENFRCDDVFARIGGDEFCLVLEGHLQKLTECKLEQIRETLIRENAKNYPVNFSYGVMVVTTNRKNITLNDILEIADRRMYNQKRLHKRIS